MAGQEPEFDGQLPQPAGKAIDLEKRLQQKTQGRPEPGPPAGGARLPNCLPDFCPGSFLSPSSYPFLSSAGRTGFSSVAEKEHRKKTGPPAPKTGFSKHQFPGAFEKDKLPALILAGAPGAFGFRVLAIHMPDKFHLVAETRRASDFLLLILLQIFHSI